MRHGIICPTYYLTEFASLSNYHLVLAHMVEGDEGYRDFYKNLDTTNFITLDNSSYEVGDGVYSTDNLIKIGEEINAAEIMAPETFEDGRDTARKILKFCNEVPLGVKVFGTIHGKTLEELIDCFLRVYKSISTVGFSCRLDFEDDIILECSNKSLERSFKRLYVVNTIFRVIQKRKLNVSHLGFHLLGMNHPIEVMWYDNRIRSCDSSCAYVSARNRILLGSNFCNYTKDQNKVNFSEKNFSKRDKLILLSNILFINSLMRKSEI